MIHTGDIAYDNGTLRDFESKFFARLRAAARAASPVFPASGNHEYDTADAAPFREVFVLPENGAAGGASAGIRTTGATSTSSRSTPSGPAPEQAAWLEADLAANRCPGPIVYGHKPPHSSGDHGDDARLPAVLRAGPGDAPRARWC